MPDGDDVGGGIEAAVKVVAGIKDVPAVDWDACAGTANPFLSHAFLSAPRRVGCRDT
jgi:uncharacterized protein